MHGTGSEAGSYLRLIDFVSHSTLGFRVIKKKRSNAWHQMTSSGRVFLRNTISHRELGPFFRNQATGVPRSLENAPPKDPTLGLSLWPYGGPRGWAFSYERGTPVTAPLPWGGIVFPRNTRWN